MFATRTRRRAIGSASLLLPILWLLGGGLAAAAVLWAAGIVRWPLGDDAAQQPALHVPVAARPIAAYASVTHDDLADPTTRTFAVKRIPLAALPGQVVTVLHGGEEHTGPVQDVLATDEGPLLLVDGRQVPASAVVRLGEALLRPGDILGRVVARDKRPGFGFQESDFLPRGSRPGVAGGTPPGMLSLTLSASRIKGVHALRAGDRIDVLAHIPLEHVPQFAAASGGLPGAALVLSTSSGSSASGSGSKQQRTEAHVVAQGAVVVSPVSLRQAPTTSASLTQGQVVRHVPVEELVLAVDPADLAPLSDALSLGVEMIALTHSGRPGAEQDRPPPAGMVAVPVAARALAAYEALRHEDLLDPRTRRPRWAHLPAEEAERQGVVVDVAELTGRVLRRDMLPGEYFRRDDLMPPGTRAGLAGAVPAGKVSLVLPAERFPGIQPLRRGDRCHVLCSVPIDLRSTADTRTALVVSPQLQDRLEVRVLARDAVVLAPVGSLPDTPAADQPGRAGGAASDAPRQFVLAVDPAETGPLHEALARNWDIRCVVPTGSGPLPDAGSEAGAGPASGRPTDGGPAATRPTPHAPGVPGTHVPGAAAMRDAHATLGSDPLRDAATLDLIVAGKRQRWIFVTPPGALQPRDALRPPAEPQRHESSPRPEVAQPPTVPQPTTVRDAPASLPSRSAASASSAATRAVPAAPRALHTSVSHDAP